MSAVHNTQENIAIRLYQEIVMGPQEHEHHLRAWTALHDEEQAPYRAAALATLQFLHSASLEESGVLAGITIVTSRLFGNGKMAEISRALGEKLTAICAQMAVNSYLSTQQDAPCLRERSRISLKQNVAALRNLTNALLAAAMQGDQSALLETLRTWEGLKS